MKKSELRKLIKEELFKEIRNPKGTTDPGTYWFKQELMDVVNRIDSIIGKAWNDGKGELDKDTFHKIYGINNQLFDVVDRL
jgi:hypothetical protein